VRDALPDPVVEQLVTDYRASKGVTPRQISDEEIVQRCVYALVNEGARILEEGIAVRASDIDLVYLNGYGFPAHRGGPMCYANEVGLFNVARSLQGFAAEAGAFDWWQPAPLLRRLADDGQTFA
jgi:3-hydroxyacyl-CoA dehydrogenase